MSTWWRSLGVGVGRRKLIIKGAQPLGIRNPRIPEDWRTFRRLNPLNVQEKNVSILRNGDKVSWLLPEHTPICVRRCYQWSECHNCCPRSTCTSFHVAFVAFPLTVHSNEGRLIKDKKKTTRLPFDLFFRHRHRIPDSPIHSILCDPKRPETRPLQTSIPSGRHIPPKGRAGQTSFSILNVFFQQVCRQVDASIHWKIEMFKFSFFSCLAGIFLVRWKAVFLSGYPIRGLSAAQLEFEDTIKVQRSEVWDFSFALPTRHVWNLDKEQEESTIVMGRQFDIELASFHSSITGSAVASNDVSSSSSGLFRWSRDTRPGLPPAASLEPRGSGVTHEKQ